MPPLPTGLPPNITAINKTNPTDCETDNGTITIVATGPSLEYSIDDGASFQTDPMFVDLAADYYDIVVRLSGTSNCLDEGSVTLTSPTNPAISSIIPVNTTDCGLNDGQITINASPGPLQYSIDNGFSWSSGSSFANLGPGDFDIVVRKVSAPACRFTGTTTIRNSSISHPYP